MELEKTKELRFLQIDFNLELKIEELAKVYEDICLEIEKLTGSKDYSRSLEKADYNLYQAHFLNAVTFCRESLLLGANKDAQEIIDLVNIKVNGKKIKIKESEYDKENIKVLESLIKSIESRFKIKQEKEPKQEVQEWEDLRVYIQVALGVLPEYNCPVKQFIYYDKSAKKIIQLRKENGN